MVYDGLAEGNHTIEGPKFYKREGYYYILAPAGGVEQGWQLALRSKHIYGPYESKVVFNKDGIHQGGWVVHQFLCFQERGAYGRILHLLDVNWKDGWPMMKQRPHTPSPQLSTVNCQLTIPIYSQHYT
jgi:beta-xylosidase